MSSRLVPAANFGSFKNRFTTDDNFTSFNFFDGQTKATAVINPVNESVQNSAPTALCFLDGSQFFLVHEL